jgi:hypothetical protein
VGLQPPLSLDVEIHNPQSLVVAMSLARKLEQREQYVGVAASLPAPPQAPARGLLTGPPPQLALPAPSTRTGSSTVSVEGRQVKRLSQIEMEECRCHNLCFNCNEKFGRGHNRVYSAFFSSTWLNKMKLKMSKSLRTWWHLRRSIRISRCLPWRVSAPAKPCRCTSS